MRSRTILLLLALFALTVLAVPSAGLGAKHSRGVSGTPLDTRFATDAELALPLVGDLAAVANSPALAAKGDAAARSAGMATARLRAAAAPAPVPGEVRNWIALDDSVGFYRKGFTFRGMGDKVEVWVASERRTLLGVTSRS